MQRASPTSAGPPSWPTGRDALLALALLAGCALWFWSTRTQALIQDGPGLVDGFLFGEPPYCPHAAYYPLAHALQWLAPKSASPAAVLWWLSALGAAVGVACCYGLLRALGSSLSAALAFALLAAATPALQLHAGIVELHALHFGAVALALLASVLALRGGARVWLPVFALAALALYTTHKTAVLLLPAWALLPWVFARDPGRPWRAPLLACAALAAGLALAMQLTQLRMGGAGAAADIGENAAVLRQFARGFSFEWLRTELAGGLVCWLPLAAWGLWCARGERAARALALALALPLAFFALWGERNGGGYLLGALPCAAWAASRARASSPALGATALLLAIAVQAAGVPALLALWRPQAPAARELEPRAQAAEAALGGAGFAIALDRSAYPVHLWRPAIREWRVNTLVPADAAPEQAAQALAPALDLLVAQAPGRVAALIGCSGPPAPAWAAYGDALRALCEARYLTRSYTGFGWRVLVLAPKP